MGAWGGSGLLSLSLQEQLELGCARALLQERGIPGKVRTQNSSKPPCAGTPAAPFQLLLPSCPLLSSSPCPGGHQMWLKPGRMGLICSIPARSCPETGHCQGRNSSRFSPEKREEMFAALWLHPWGEASTSCCFPRPCRTLGMLWLCFLAEEDSRGVEWDLQGHPSSEPRPCSAIPSGWGVAL